MAEDKTIIKQLGKKYNSDQVERNILIVKDHLNGLSYSKLSRKYDLTSTRIGHLINSWKPRLIEEGLV